MAKKVTGYIKLQIPAGKATPAPPVGPALGQHGVNIVEFTKQFNARTADKGDLIIQDPAGSCPSEEGMQAAEGIRYSEQGEGRYDLQGRSPEDRGTQDAGS